MFLSVLAPSCKGRRFHRLFRLMAGTAAFCLSSLPVGATEVTDGLLKRILPHGKDASRFTCVIDGSHNPEGVQNMVKSIHAATNNGPVHCLFACFTDKNIERMLSYLGESCKDITLTTFPNRRARQMEDYFLYLEDYPFKEDPLAALEEIKTNYPGEPILITGSLAFAAYMKRLIK